MAAEEHADIRALDAALDAVDDDARTLIDGLTAEQGIWRPAPAAWSIAHCLDHLRAAAIIVGWCGGPRARTLSQVPLDQLESRAVTSLARPLRRTLFFAGEAVEAERGTGTVDGAISSGRRAAKQVLRALG